MISEDNPDILCFTEILNKNKSSLIDAELSITGYDHFFNEEDAKRGAIIYTKKGLNAKIFTGFSGYLFEEDIWCHMETKNGEKILIGNIYRSPNSSGANTSTLFDMLKDPQIDLFDRVLITGDFNFPQTKWNQGENNEIKENIRDAFLHQHITEATHHRGDNKKNILDLVLTRDPDDISDIEYCSPIGKSHHLLLKIKTNILFHKLEEEEQSRFQILSK